MKLPVRHLCLNCGCLTVRSRLTTLRSNQCTACKRIFEGLLPPFFLGTSYFDENVPLECYKPVSASAPLVAFEARRTIFTFQDEYGKMVSGPLIFYFSYQGNFSASALEEARKTARRLEDIYAVPPETLAYTQDGSHGICFSVPQHAFRRSLPGNFLPFVYAKMITRIVPDSFRTAKKDIYAYGNLSTETSPRKKLPDGSCNFQLTTEEVFNEDPSALITYARARNKPLSDERDRILRRMESARRSCKSPKLAELYRECLRELYHECLTGRAVLNISCETDPEFDLYFPKPFAKCQLLKEIVEKPKPTLRDLNLLLTVCRRFGDHGRQVLYMHNELFWPRGNQGWHNKEWVGKTDPINEAPPKCRDLRRSGMCKKVPACGVLHPAELAHADPIFSFSPPIINKTKSRRQLECEAAVQRWLQRHEQLYVYKRDIERVFNKTYTSDLVAAATVTLVTLKVLHPVFPRYDRPRGRRPQTLFIVNARRPSI